MPLLLISGLLAGVLAGLLGVGGGIVVVPMLYHVYLGADVKADVAMPLAVGTSLSTIVLTSLISAYGHNRRGSVDWKLVRRWTPWVVLGVTVGTLAGGSMSSALLRMSFGIMLILVGMHMLVSVRRSLTIADMLPRVGAQRGFATLVGGLSAMLGIGGGILTVPFLNLYSYPIRRALGTAAVFGFVISVPATLGYVLTGLGRDGLPPSSTGWVNWLAFASLVPATTLAAPLGVRLSHYLNVVVVKQAFAAFLLLIGVKMIMF